MSHTISLIDGASQVSGPPRHSSYSAHESWTIWDGSFLANQACYVRGALVVTMRGAVQAENLTVGDVIFTPLGKRTVTWIDQSCWSAAERTAPVCVRPEAITYNLPETDVLVAPWHCLWVENRLLPAVLLINGLSVTQNPVEAVYYCHVCFDRPTLAQLAVSPGRVAPIWSVLANHAKRLGYVKALANERPNRDVRLVVNRVSVGPKT